VRLAGQMQESAFLNPPWLLEREGAGYVQVTELLYRIAEQATGSNTVEQIAANISAAGKPVSPITVRSLIAQLLIPRGLVEMADGSVVPVAAGGPSPIALNMRMRMISPETIMPVTNVLRALFWPPVLVVVLLVTAVAQGWLYFVHGIGTGLHDALYTPGLMVIILLVVVVSAAFHELGHAAALHYAGGRIKGMGAGLYIVYPAFFTDVSDNYRLPRWQRVRTDLGGFYFNLIFALGIMGLYTLSGQEFLLLMVLMINFEIIHQLMPFLRLDGYWTLADITGVPDFFSQMTAFVRSVLPVKAWKGRKLPPLKWWAKLVFAVYTLITVPLLVLLIVLMVRSVPRVMATAWDSFGQQSQAFLAAQAGGNVLGMLGSAGQAVLLLIPTVGLAYTLFSLAKRFTTALWNWGKPSAARRAVSAVCFVSTAGLVGFMWLPQMPLPGRQPQPAPVSLGPISPVNWQPIAADERGTVQDAVSDAAGPAVAAPPTVEPTTSPATPLPTAPATPQPTAQPGVPPPITDVQTRGTPEPTLAATPAAQAQATAQPTAQFTAQPTPQPVGQATALPRATLTPTPPPRATATPPPRATPTPTP
jgi:putative peptide zinc metalloprotease protein